MTEQEAAEHPLYREWQGWRQERMTQLQDRLLANWKQVLMEQWAARQFDTPEANAAALGEIGLLNSLTSMTFEEFIEAIDTEEADDDE